MNPLEKFEKLLCRDNLHSSSATICTATPLENSLIITAHETENRKTIQEQARGSGDCDMNAYWTS